jgi:hypothetical protein
VVAAGGIADGRGMAAVLMLGAQGALMGTRFYASQEAEGHPEAKRRIVEAEGGRPSRTAAPVVLDQIPKHFDDRSGRKYLDELPRNLDLFSPTSPQIEPQVVARAEPEIK